MWRSVESEQCRSLKLNFGATICHRGISKSVRNLVLRWRRGRAEGEFCVGDFVCPAGFAKIGNDNLMAC
jgi:hypothetical protein